jgi:hypothetical protein
MVIFSWDEISGEWATHELPIDTKDPIEINLALGASLVDSEVGVDALGDESPDGWVVESSGWSGPVLTIVSRDERNHLAVTVAIYE